MAGRAGGCWRVRSKDSYYSTRPTTVDWTGLLTSCPNDYNMDLKTSGLFYKFEREDPRARELMAKAEHKHSAPSSSSGKRKRNVGKTQNNSEVIIPRM